MAKTMLSEAEAWRWIAAKLANCRESCFDGYLCIEADLMEYRRQVSADTANAMRERVDAHLDYGRCAFHDDDPSAVDREARVIAALWFALDADTGVASSQVVGGEKAHG